MQHASSNFVGFTRLETLLATHSSRRALYGAAAVTRPLAGDVIEEHWAVVADLQDGACRYWRMRLAAVPVEGALRPDTQVIAARVASALQALEVVVKSRRFRFEAGLMAIPNELPLIACDTDLIVYDRLADRYRPRPDVSAAAQAGEGA